MKNINFMAKWPIYDFNFKYLSPSGRNINHLITNLSVNRHPFYFKSLLLFSSVKGDQDRMAASGSCSSCLQCRRTLFVICGCPPVVSFMANVEGFFSHELSLCNAVSFFLPCFNFLVKLNALEK